MNYKIIGIKNLFNSQLENPFLYREDERGNTEDYDTLAAARDVVTGLDQDIYVTGSGEAGRPEYYILEERDFDYMRSGRNGDGGNYDWGNCDCKADKGDCCGSCETCCLAMCDEDIEWIKTHAITE